MGLLSTALKVTKAYRIDFWVCPNHQWDKVSHKVLLVKKKKFNENLILHFIFTGS